MDGLGWSHCWKSPCWKSTMIQWKLGFEVAAVVCQSRLSLQMFAPPSDDLWPQEFLGSDAAPDELKTLRLNTQLQWFRNARIRVRDAAHAAGRFLTQIEPLVLFWNLISQSSCQLKLISYNFPNLRLTQKWNKIPMLKEVWYKYCWSSNSIISLIHHSPQNVRIFRKYEPWPLWVWCSSRNLNEWQWESFPMPLNYRLIRWKKIPRGPGKPATYVSPNIATRACWNQHQGSFSTRLQSFMQQWRLLSLRQWPFPISIDLL